MARRPGAHPRRQHEHRSGRGHPRSRRAIRRSGSHGLRPPAPEAQAVRLWDRWARRAGYWEGLASGAAVLTTSYGSPNNKAVLPQLTAWAQSAYASNSVVFSAILLRLMLFSEATFQFQAKDDKHLFGNTDLRILEEPWPDGSTGELLVRMEQDVSLAGKDRKS